MVICVCCCCLKKLRKKKKYKQEDLEDHSVDSGFSRSDSVGSSRKVEMVSVGIQNQCESENENENGNENGSRLRPVVREMMSLDKELTEAEHISKKVMESDDVFVEVHIDDEFK